MIQPMLKVILQARSVLKCNNSYIFCDQIIKKKQDQKNIIEPQYKNSIMPKTQEGFAYGHYFPKQWTEQKIQKILDPSLKQIQRVSIVKTKVGQHSGKIIIKFKDGVTRKKYIEKYNEDFITADSQTQKVVILPFELKTIEQKKKAREGKNFKYPVRISNLDFDITQNQIQKLAQDYGQISHIEMNCRQSGVNKGFATVYFESRNSALQFVSFLDGLLYRDRKLKAHLMVKKVEKVQKNYLKVPTFTFKANEQLMKKLKSKQFELN